jgi:hypothetical protein
MKARRTRSPRRLNELSVLVVPLLWIILWQAWPAGVRAHVPARSISPMRVRYTPQSDDGGRDPQPLIFVRSPLSGDEMIADDGPEVLRGSKSSGETHLLERPAPEESAVVGLEFGGPPAAAEFRPALPAARVFQSGASVRRDLVVEASSALRRRGFRLPGVSATSFGNTNAGWQVTMTVECGEDGRAEGVFVDSGTADPAFNLAVARTVQGSAVIDPGAACRGGITVSYGEE